MGYLKHIIKGFSITFITSIVVAFLTYGYRIYLSRNLSITEFGLFYSVFAFLGFFMGFVDLGFSRTMVKYIPQYLVEKRKDLVKASIIFVGSIILIVALISVIVFFLLAPFLSTSYFKDETAKLVIIGLSISFVFSSGVLLLRQTFLGFQKIGFFSSIELTKIILLWVTTFIFFIFFNNIFSPVLGYIFSFLVVLIIYAYIFWKLVFPDLFQVKYSLTKPFVKELIYFSLPATMTIFGGIFANYIDTIFLTYLQGVKEAAVYNVAFPTAALIGYIGMSLRYVFFPTISELWTKNEKEKLLSGIYLFNKYVPLLLLPLSLLIFEFAPVIITVLFKQEYLPATMPLRILLFGNIALSLALMYTTTLVAIGKPKYDAVVIISSGFINLILNALLIPQFSTGGAALATSISYLCMFILAYYFLRKTLQFQNPFWNWIKLIFISGIFYASLALLRNIFSANIYMSILVSSFISLLLYLLLLFASKIITLHEITSLFNSLGFHYGKK
ncbi:flippase [Candidatus Woesearchaeota archaeon]|nr:flippase [Candidatus Woesearchaeota archaeon]